jgi:hypothetical protein
MSDWESFEDVEEENEEEEGGQVPCSIATPSRRFRESSGSPDPSNSVSLALVALSISLTRTPPLPRTQS